MEIRAGSGPAAPPCFHQKKVGYFVKKGVKKPAGVTVGGGAPPKVAEMVR